MISSRLACSLRQFSTSGARSGLHGGSIGENLPFSLNNRYKTTIYFIAFFGSGFAIPFFALRHQLLKS